MQAILIPVKSDWLAPDKIIIEKEIIIGRGEDCTLTIKDNALSRKHLKIYIEDGAIRIKDLGSKNGTFVNRKRIQETLLKDGDEIIAGKNIFRIEILNNINATESFSLTELLEQKNQETANYDSMAGLSEAQSEEQNTSEKSDISLQIDRVIFDKENEEEKKYYSSNADTEEIFGKDNIFSICFRLFIEGIKFPVSKNKRIFQGKSTYFLLNYIITAFISFFGISFFINEKIRTLKISILGSIYEASHTKLILQSLIMGALLSVVSFIVIFIIFMKNYLPIASIFVKYFLTF